MYRVQEKGNSLRVKTIADIPITGSLIPKFELLLTNTSFILVLNLLSSY